jgi:hypothetical protein
MLLRGYNSHCCGAAVLQCNATLRLAFLRRCSSNAALQQQCSGTGRYKNNVAALGDARTTHRRWALQ